ncbi:MAG: pyrroline-5-carboxylate reductase [Deltaproteobacteria bacterium]|nr:pyrroline-5-carboxylate reductase [Deltaproteobacteria bacterium]
MKLAIIGGGSMGTALAGRFLTVGTAAPENLLVIEKSKERRAQLKDILACRLESEISSELSQADLVWLAVKPQDLDVVCSELKPHLCAHHLVVSIMAGVTVAVLEKRLGRHARLVRAMPNLPLSLGEGMTVYYPHPQLVDQDFVMLEQVLSAVGACLRLETEDMIDAATALSGSGPAYFFYFLEYTLQAAQQLGFTPEQARLMVAQTFKGAMALWLAGEEDVAALRKRVTSKGGTTAAAVAVFDAGRLGEVLYNGILQAHKRAKELGAASS